jgi:hypothetical protein
MALPRETRPREPDGGRNEEHNKQYRNGEADIHG